ncbi:hypothetical protein C7M84_010671 [Penaeus vannamei]|uniref:K Homology domain-containing protein n=1 Tax=Penaeus vannamei TaxID=6689 RepID=A0A3R7M9W0_PENVA|nr:hypothetical protein C7M84_010671 [Penaeus vannamei]
MASLSNIVNLPGTAPSPHSGDPTGFPHPPFASTYFPAARRAYVDSLKEVGRKNEAGYWYFGLLVAGEVVSLSSITDFVPSTDGYSSESSGDSLTSSDLEDDVEFAAQMCKVKGFGVQKNRPAPAQRREAFLREEDRRRFFQQAGKAAEKFDVKLFRPHAGNLVAPFLVKSKEEATCAYMQHIENFVQALRMLAKQALGIWLEMPFKEEEPSESCTRWQGKDRALLLKKLGEIEGQVCSSETTSSDIAPAHYGKVIGKGGARLKYIHEKYGVRVSIPKDKESSITVSGKSDSVCGAIKEVEELVQKDELLQLPIGKGGSHAAKVQEEFGVKLHTKSREHSESRLVVKGPLSAAEKAVASIKLNVAGRRRLNEERCRREEETKVKIQLPERNKPDAQILVTGLKENAQAVVAQLELMANLKLRPKHVLVSLRIKSDEHILVLGPSETSASGL